MEILLQILPEIIAWVEGTLVFPEAIIIVCHCVSLVSKHLVFRSYWGDFDHEELCVGGHEQSMWNVQISGLEKDLSDICT